MAWYDDLAGFWDEWGDEILQVGGSLLDASLANQGQRDAANAYRAGSDAAVGLQRDIYNRNVALATPGYIQGGDAANKLAAIHGIKPQDYAGAIKGNALISGGGGSAFYSSDPNVTGAGQPVPGHSGGGGNALASRIGGGIGQAAGSALFGPIGGAIGSALGSAAGGMFRQSGPKGDNWTTIRTVAPAGYDYDAYWAQDPNFASEWAKPDVRALFGNNRDAFLWNHYETMGRDRTMTKLPVADGAAGATGDTGSSGSTGSGNAFSDPMKDFWDSPYGKLAVSGFRNIDTPEIDGSFATGGQALSGAKIKALDDRGRARSGPAFGDYTNSLRSIAGMVPVATNQIGGAGSEYGNFAGNAFLNQGQVNANAATNRNSNWRNFLKNSAEAFY